ncbi:2-C-methyl-D-erythritol 2,4-cyclodiphosphate synthase [Geofilum rubicundum]|uniref:2-C-methyl-D-erythritol 2,4-cyclodiphosphate synthase n=1 Tax=Geofilum rubicundum JCM 15548 TaxID=1236989 RepID=A0A0E9LSQ4_9BACT|nr:2-C-methyl-D-erythritol 2,4-cyclodiphosphate synthase [Geofilum rubicundum]GAO28181.1 2-C-methyl-D-erythritol 2,4-cyclodiphosphate synthase [Geofilum rubicundum JCM 15548]
MNWRVGMGYDVHQLASGYRLWVGGIEIPFEKGSVGHSDGDVLIHAICDALLGAANLRDIGYHFPDTDPSLKGIDSKILLEKTMALLRSHAYEVGNIDSTICLQLPKINPFIPNMQTALSGVMKLDLSQISIKATTTEKMGFVGTGEGISAYATVLIYKV